ncbi:helix-turn-helix domain-containing protein [Rhizobacter sp. Root1221]|uniref:helix-turn-helix domain-containing protein n=1 Tax=Rhizobacter sp. Root1221 TaxID=1736433 RepID=UPI0007009484|nr:helix-turn-helix transcriptional regulator [Rhizobacter sp. Root1221]KQV99946.1 hypothetical protein ASC87_19795 [Rhizobacter sp. Root1221]
MTVPTSSTTRVLRKRFGAWLKETRETAGLTQLDLAMKLDFAYPTMVSQIERGISALPTHDLKVWAEALGLSQKDFANQWLYYMEPNVWAALNGKNPLDIERLPRSAPTIARRSQKAGTKAPR